MLLGGAAAVVSLLAAAPAALASPASRPGLGGPGAISPILQTGDLVTGVRGTTNGNVVLTGSAMNGSSVQMTPFLVQGRLTSAAYGAPVSLLRPPFAGVTSATFYGPDTHSFNPSSIPAGQVRAVGSYGSSWPPLGVRNHGMIYTGPVSGGGSWTSIDVPANGANTVGHVRACPQGQASCFVMDTIAHSTMGDLVVGNYDLNPTISGGLVSGNAFIYNLSTRQWTLLRLGGSLSSGTSIYGIWQDGGDASVIYTLAGGSSAHGPFAHGNERAFLVNYNEQTGAFGRPRYYNYGNAPAAFTHFDGITAVPGGFNLVAVSSVQSSSMAFVPVHHGSFGPATWYPVNVATSRVCPSGCSMVTGNTVYRNQVMGLYVPSGLSATTNTYLASVQGW
jgi:hypothetical protein